MEKKNEKNLVEKLKSFQDTGSFTQSKLAKMLGINEGALSAWLKNKYEGKNEEIDSKVEKFLTMQEKKNQNKITDFDFLPTSIAKQVFAAAQYCHLDSLIGICYGTPGLGKTTAIKEYANNNTGVVIIECEERMKVKLLVETLYKKLNLGDEKNWDLQDMKEKILNKLKDSNWLIIVDEAEHLSEDAFTTLRRLHDFSECSFGILFTGTQKLYNNLMRLKGEFLYLTSRIAFQHSLKDLTEEDVELIVKNVLPDADVDLVSDIYGKSNKNARVLTNVLKRALKLSKQHKTEINSDLIAASREMLIA